MAFKKKWTSKRDAMGSAIGTHVCTACLNSSATTFKTCLKCKADGMRVYFPSQEERKRGAQLIRWHAEGKISNLKFHPRVDLIVEGTKLCAYEADSYYIRDGKQIYEDVKPPGDFIESTSALKIALFNALNKKHGLEVTIYRSS